MKWLKAEEEFESWFSTKASFCFKFHDARQAMGAAGGSKRIFTTSHPADYVVVDCGEMFYAEVKSSQEMVSFPFDSIRKSQWSAAMQTNSAGGSYFFFVRSEHRKCWYRIPASVMLELRTGSAKSVKWEHLEPLKYERQK